MKAEILHLDTCLADYFQGYSGAVLCIPVDPSMTAEDVRYSLHEALEREFQPSTDEEWVAAQNAIDELKCNSGYPFSDVDEQDENSETVYAYFGIKFNKEEV